MEGMFEGLSESVVLEKLRRLARHSDGLVPMSDLAFALGVRREPLEAILRQMEARGLVVCAPRIGAVSVLAPSTPRGGLRGYTAGVDDARKSGPRG